MQPAEGGSWWSFLTARGTSCSLASLGDNTDFFLFIPFQHFTCTTSCLLWSQKAVCWYLWDSSWGASSMAWTTSHLLSWTATSFSSTCCHPSSSTQGTSCPAALFLRTSAPFSSTRWWGRYGTCLGSAFRSMASAKWELLGCGTCRCSTTCSSAAWSRRWTLWPCWRCLRRSTSTRSCTSWSLASRSWTTRWPWWGAGPVRAPGVQGKGGSVWWWFCWWLFSPFLSHPGALQAISIVLWNARHQNGGCVRRSWEILCGWDWRSVGRSYLWDDLCLYHAIHQGHPCHRATLCLPVQLPFLPHRRDVSPLWHCGVSVPQHLVSLGRTFGCVC